MKRLMHRAPTTRQQRGAAILTAMLTVVLVASLASATLWQQWRGVEVEAAERSRLQSSWVLTGALDWARLILREDARQGGADHLAEPWAVPLEPARLSTFLAADRSNAQAADTANESFLAGQIIDLQSRLNVANLVLSGTVNEPAQRAFARLFELLNLPANELTTLTDNLRLAQPDATDKARSFAATSSYAPLWPQDIDQLAWVGLSAPTVEALRPFVTVLPQRTPVNLNTASAEVLYACIDAFELADAHRLVTARNAKHLTTLAEVNTLSGKQDAQLSVEQHSVNSQFFEIRGALQIENMTVQEQSVVQREGMNVKTISRKRGVVPQTAPPTMTANPRL